MSVVYLNGDYLPIEKAQINVMDRGFIFADSVYDVIPVFNKKVFRLEKHLQRLNNNLAAIYIDAFFSDEQWSALFYHLLEQNAHHQAQSLYVQVTRGVSARDHNIDICEQPTVFVMCRPIIRNPEDRQGVKAITHQDIRWHYCNIKAVNLLPSIILRHRAKLQGAREAILIRDGYVSEGAASNVFISKNGVIKTPPKDDNILPGITRDLVLELLDKEQIVHRKTMITAAELNDADEVWLTGSLCEIMPVVQLNDKPVGDGRAGAVWKEIDHLYQQYKQKISGYAA